MGERARHHRHCGAEFQRHAGDVGGLQGLALVRDVGPGRLEPFAVEECLERVEVLLAQHPHADTLAARRILGLLQHETMVAGFLDAPKIEHAPGFLRDHQADHLGVEQTARFKVLDGQHHMARPGDVERRVEVLFGDLHG
jgi:hypothetical protein